MRPPYTVANIKENGLKEDIQNLLVSLAEHESILEGKTVILCVPHIYLDMVSSFIAKHKLPIFTGAQYVSKFPKGSFTGEEGAFQVGQYAKFVIVGHSERRTHLHETDEDVLEQIRRALEEGLRPIYAASNIDQIRLLKESIPDFNGLILVENISNISAGQPDDLGNINQPLNPTDANRLTEQFKNIFPNIDYLYGGSVDKDNVAVFMKYFKGYVIGARSLNPSFFLSILEKT